MAIPELYIITSGPSTPRSYNMGIQDLRVAVRLLLKVGLVETFRKSNRQDGRRWVLCCMPKCDHSMAQG